jgi:hypothetical protein
MIDLRATARLVSIKIRSPESAIRNPAGQRSDHTQRLRLAAATTRYLIETWQQLDIAQPPRADRELMASVRRIHLVAQAGQRAVKRCVVIEIAQVRPARRYVRESFSLPSPMR